jgi:hypothetical protein
VSEERDEDERTGQPRPDETPEQQLRAAANRAREAVERARPRVERLVKDATPKVQKAAQDAYDYARSHDQELRGAARALLWSRLTGPWRLAFGAFESAGAERRRETEVARTCGGCGTAAAATARFCTECGARLSDGDQDR